MEHTDNGMTAARSSSPAEGVPLPATAPMSMAPRVTSAQIAAVTVLTLLALAAGLFVAAIFGDVTMRASDTPMAPMNQERSPMPMNAPVR